MATMAQTPNPTTGDQLSKRDQIRRAALAHFLERSYSGGSLRDIAKSVGITMAGLYYYFPAKDDLLADLIAPYLDGLDELISAGEQAIDSGTPLSATTVLERFFDLMIELQDVAQLVILDAGVARHPSVASRVADQAERLVRLTMASAPCESDELRAGAAIAILYRPVVRIGYLSAVGHVRDELITIALVALCAPLVRP
jgi:AcrR family transcriptional regulator